MSLPTADPSTPFRFKALPRELREAVLGHVLACPNTVLSIDIMENLTRQGLRRPLLPKIIVTDIGRKALGGSQMQLNLPQKLAILRTDKATFTEGRRVFFQRNEFHFRDCSVVNDLKAFVKGFGLARAAEMSGLTISIERRQVLIRLLKVLGSYCTGLKHLSVMLDGCGMFIEVDEWTIRRYGVDGSSFQEVVRAQPTWGLDNATLAVIGELVTSQGNNVHGNT